MSRPTDRFPSDFATARSSCDATAK